jgi:hypothetical protein
MAIIILVLGYLFLMPININVDVRLGGGISAVSEIRIFPFSYRLRRGKHKPQTPIIKNKKTPAPKDNRLDISKLTGADLKLILSVVGESLNLLGRLFRAARYYLNADLAGGISGPDLTGQLYGAYNALRPVMPASVAISYDPDFLSEKLAGAISFGLAVRAISVVKYIVIFFFRLPIIKIFKLYRKLKH